ncbi:hypothetical protein NE237_024209 [Protea cynaroides]|uniref:Protein kinase domain-containing protein n=1 Tax=Protea cynaroides TaxID=273540 RepID=A0A9Q0HGI2_9MAGN|nr:hypothetical protein NE237_024209 [Protea cynaroides]
MRTLSRTFRTLKRRRPQEPKSSTPSSPSSSSSSRISKANPSPNSKSSSWFVYLILSTNAPIKTYVGVTNNFCRRLKQHNGELKGGAKASRAGRPWICACLIRGFKDQREACGFESKWKSISRKLPHKRKSEDMSKQVDNGSRALLQHRQAALNKLQTCSSANLTVSLSEPVKSQPNPKSFRVLHGSLLAPRAATSADNSNEVDYEIDILSKINSLRLVNLVGFTNDFRDRLLVTEFMCNGTLYETAKAVDTLHSSIPPVIHRDIKSANVLIDWKFNARLGDFGLALRCHDDDFLFRSTSPAGTIGYLDPGYVTPDNLSTKTDVFSFGILLLEIISGRKAIDIGHSAPSIVNWAIPLTRKGKLLSIYDPRIPPPKDPMVRKQLTVIVAKCVRSCRERRPSMKEKIAECLSVYGKMVPLYSWNGLSVSNRCLMVETVGFPLQSENTHLDSKASLSVGENRVMVENRSSRSLRNSRRVYSDRGLAFKSNLMDLMAGTGGVSSFRGEADGVELSSLYGVFQLSRNQSVGGSLRQRISCVDSRAVRTQAAKPL